MTPVPRHLASTLAGLAVALAALHSASAGSRADYAWQWPIELAEPAAPAHRLLLDEVVYARIDDPGLRDLEAFNAAGEPVPFGPLPVEHQRMAGTRWPVSWFSLPANGAAGDPARIRLHIERGSDGRLRRLDADIPDGTTAPAPVDLLLDLGEDHPPLDRLELKWSRGGDLVARYRVSTSDDLVGWRVLRDEVRLLDLEQGPHRLLRQRIELPTAAARYLLLDRLDDGAALAPTAIEAAGADRVEHASSPLRWTTLQPQPDPRQPGVYRYRLPGPLPIDRIALELASSNSVANVTLSSRDHEDAPWRERNRHTAFRLDGADGAVDSDPQAIATTRDRDWQLRSEPPLDRPPTLQVGWHPDGFALLARGDAPYQLAAGSRRAQRADYPLALLLDGLRARGGDWNLPQARLGSGAPLSGDDALARPLPLRQWALWAVLLLGAALVIGMVMKLARQP